MSAPRCGECIKARPGQRVVRGPNWWGGNEDGGSHYVGTVVSVCQPETGSGYTTHPVEVHWDTGEGGCYRASCMSQTFDLRLIDASPAGVVFSNITCNFCGTKDVTGTRWKCANCAEYNLCHPCYMSDKHNLEHQFLRYDEPGATGVQVSSRKTSEKFKFYGIFSGAEVQSDNGDKTGVIGNIRGDARLLRKTDAGNSCYYNSDKVDDSLKFKKAACAGFYYMDHMPKIALPGHDPNDIKLFNRYQKTVPEKDYVQVITSCIEIGRHQYVGIGYDFSFEWTHRYSGKQGLVLSIASTGYVQIQVEGEQLVLNPRYFIPVHKTPRRAFGRSISTGSKGLGYGLSKMTALHAACLSGEEDVVTALVMAEADLEEPDENGDRAVHYAAGCKQSRILELLLNSGVDTGAYNIFGETALHVAVKENSAVCALILAKNIRASDVNIQDNVGNTVLHSAIQAGMQQEIISLILQLPTVNVAIKNQNGETPLHIAAVKATPWETQQILQISTEIVDEKTKNGFTALYYAACNNRYEIMKTLVMQGQCNLDVQSGRGLTALAAAVTRGCCDAVEFLVESGADINTPNSAGDTPLHICATNKKPLRQPSLTGAPKLSLMVQTLQEASSQCQVSALAMAGLLASRGGDLQKKNKKNLTPPQLCDSTALVEMLLFWNTQERAAGRYSEQLSALINTKDENDMALLHREAMNGRHHIAQMLLEQGFTQVDTVGGKELKTALSIAVEGGHRKFVEVLIEAGADLNKTDADGNAPLHISMTRNHCEITELLVAAGADVNKQDANGNTPLHISLMSRLAVKASKLSSTKAPKLKEIATELENLRHEEIDSSLALACFFISSGSSLKLKNAQGLNPLNIAGTIPVVRTLLKWAPKTRGPPPKEASVQTSAEHDTAGAEGSASSTETTGAPGPSDEQAHCSPAKEEPKEEEIDDRHACAICMEKERTVAFLCGHGTCQECATKIQQCHVCRAPVEKIIKLYEG